MVEFKGNPCPNKKEGKGQHWATELQESHHFVPVRNMKLTPEKKGARLAVGTKGQPPPFLVHPGDGSPEIGEVSAKEGSEHSRRDCGPHFVVLFLCWNGPSNLATEAWPILLGH